MGKYGITTRPLTPLMLEILMDCHERELMKLEPCNAGTLHHTSGLISRGMLHTKTHLSGKGKKFIALYVTRLGKIYLSTL